MADPTTVPVPPRMAHLARDRRGYPIPVMVLVDDTGRPHFQINEESERQRIIREDRCAICGSKLFRGRWFVGGPMSAFSVHGLYMDPPMHAECVQYALRVCPYLAAPNYSKRLDGKTLKPGDAKNHMVMIDPTEMPGRPTWFVAVMAVAEDYVFATGEHAVAGLSSRAVRYCRHHVGSVRDVQVWREGVRITDPQELAAFFVEVASGLVGLGENSGRADMWKAFGAPPPIIATHREN